MNRRMPNGTYGGVKGWRKSTLFDLELLALLYAFGQEVLNLTVDGSEVVFGPACYVRPKRFGQT